MALVRCPIHKIPYNDENPRGCPACAREREGGDEHLKAMRELRRASTALRRPPDVRAPAPDAEPTVPAAPPSPVTQPPRKPTVRDNALQRLWQSALERRTVSASVIIAAALLTYLVATSGPKFVPGFYPPDVSDSVLPLPVEPRGPLNVVFAILGTRTPAVHPTNRNLARYSYGTDLAFDTYNTVIYQIVLRVPNRAWRGLRVGLSQRHTEGTLALLGQPTSDAQPSVPPPYTVGRYRVYPSLDERPHRTITAEVRPPNGCYDAIVHLQPRAMGVLVDGERRYAVMGTGDVSLEWVVTEVRAVNRAISVPGATAAAC